MSTKPSQLKGILVFYGLLWCALAYLIIQNHLTVSGSDVFIFKEAGVNLATRGEFVVSNLPYMAADEEYPYAYYPPIYPFLFGVWTKVFGIGLKASAAFDLLLQFIRSLALLAFCWPWLSSRKWQSCTVPFFVVGVLFAISFLSSDGDRPDELASIFGLICWWAMGGVNYLTGRAPRETRKEYILLSGVALGLCGATSPAAGAFFALGVCVAFFRRKGWLLSQGAIALFVFLLCNLPIYLMNPGSWGIFSKGVNRSTFPYKIPFITGHSWDLFVETLTWCLKKSIAIGYLHFICLFLMLSFCFMYRRPQRTYSPFHWVPLLYFPLIVFVWSLQPYYQWFGCLVLVPLTLFTLVEQQGTARAMGWIVLIVAFGPLLARTGFGLLLRSQADPQQSVQSIQQAVLARVPQESRLAVSPDQYFTFRALREVSNISYVCRRSHLFDYAYVTPNSRRRNWDRVFVPCEHLKRCFDIDTDFRTQQPFKWMGYETPYFVWGNGGILYRNVRCPPAKKKELVRSPQKKLES